MTSFLNADSSGTERLMLLRVGVVDVSVVASVSRKRMYCPAADLTLPSSPVAAQSLHAMRSSDVEVSTPIPVPSGRSASKETRQVPSIP